MTRESFAAIKKRYRRFEILGAACFCATFLIVGVGVLPHADQFTVGNS
jgi:hypothetical protein